ncbi:hypothetical protein GUJ93_ZPchr0010g9354 [Zizania palustris]|uniref:Uncharacterized protein n=1 Tax=Zizania palustris TaxID=103762 RepID=A0A8J5W7U4_ZIZPA|nr:hypothetical protein GUJ93_ZPchr0010g9354 [Zizania palustris]
MRRRVAVWVRVRQREGRETERSSAMSRRLCLLADGGMWRLDAACSDPRWRGFKGSDLSCAVAVQNLRVVKASGSQLLFDVVPLVASRQSLIVSSHFPLLFFGASSLLWSSSQWRS